MGPRIVQNNSQLQLQRIASPTTKLPATAFSSHLSRTALLYRYCACTYSRSASTCTQMRSPKLNGNRGGQLMGGSRRSNDLEHVFSTYIYAKQNSEGYRSCYNIVCHSMCTLRRGSVSAAGRRVTHNKKTKKNTRDTTTVLWYVLRHMTVAGTSQRRCWCGLYSISLSLSLSQTLYIL